MVVYYAMTESELRSNLAAIAERHGWLVEEEAFCGSFGRIDLLLDRTIVVELKLSLTTTRDVRLALAQVEGYRRWWQASNGTCGQAWLVSLARPNTDAGYLYPEVTVADVARFVRFLSSPNNVHHDRASDRVEQLRSELVRSEQAQDAVMDAKGIVDALLAVPTDVLMLCSSSVVKELIEFFEEVLAAMPE